MAQLRIGGRLSAGGDTPPHRPLDLDSDRLTTHAVLLGMTGSGKTGLGIVLLEELIRARIPPIIVDPKGDMANLMLTFPKLDGPSFAPWVDPVEARQRGLSVEALGSATADRWSVGLDRWGLGGSDISALRASARFTVYTPGSRAGMPLNVLGSLSPPEGSVDDEATQESIGGFVSGLLGLLGIDADPIASREAILLANIVHHAWAERRNLSFPELIAAVSEPPFRKLGVFELHAFYPPEERRQLALRLNGLLASPSFAPWMEGPALDIGALLDAGDKTAVPIFYLAHLDDRARMFFVTLLFGKIVSWMRGQSGSKSMRAAVYMDEVFGYLPPTANPPSKTPMLTLLKQGRAFGVGTILATQNPVDLDYKAMSNAGTWMIGRLQTERDQKRIVDGIGDPALARTLADLGPREFVLCSSNTNAPDVFTSRWALAYLRGPFTQEDIRRVQQPFDAGEAPTEPDSEQTLSRMPTVANGINFYHAHPAAEWLTAVGGDPRGGRNRAFLAARLQLRFDERKAKLDHAVEWEALLSAHAPLEIDDATEVDFDPRDFVESGSGAYEIPELPLDEVATFNAFKKAVVERVYRDEEVELHRNLSLKLYSRPDESEELFRERCRKKAADMADRDAAKLRDRFETKRERLESRLTDAERRLEDVEAEAERRKGEEWMSGASALVDVFLGGRSSTRSILTRASRKASGTLSRRSRTRRSEEKAGRVAETVEDLIDELKELEADLLDELRRIDAEWDEKVDQIEPLSIRLEKNDIHVLKLAVIWVPFRE